MWFLLPLLWHSHRNHCLCSYGEIFYEFLCQICYVNLWCKEIFAKSKDKGNPRYGPHCLRKTDLNINLLINRNQKSEIALLLFNYLYVYFYKLSILTISLHKLSKEYSRHGTVRRLWHMKEKRGFLWPAYRDIAED